jgi:hypothetical protein
MGQWGLSSWARVESWDPEPANNVVDVVYSVGETVVQPPPAGGGGAGTGGTGGTGGTAPSNGGGGGGAIDVLWLALLGVALAARRMTYVSPRRRAKAFSATLTDRLG